LPLKDPEMLLNLNSLEGISPSHLNVQPEHIQPGPSQ
jgi:hypothetical protein